MDIPEVIEEFFGVYLLYCLNPKLLGKTYIGYTTDPNRRIKQHNKGSWAGGAKRTSNRGPWKMILIVHGFPNNIAALRFEWAWQNPSNSRRLHHVDHKKRQTKKETQLEYCLRILSEMMRVGPWNRLPLSIRWLVQDYVQEFPPDKLPPIHMPICHGPVKSMKIRNGKRSKITEECAKTEQAEINSNLNLENGRHTELIDNCQNYNITSKSPTKIKKKNNLRILSQKDRAVETVLSSKYANEIVLCKLCMTLINKDTPKLTCLNLKCDLVCHLQCLAELFLESGEYVPIEGDCPYCDTRILWGHLIRKMKGCNDLPDEIKDDEDELSGSENELIDEIPDMHNTTGSDMCLNLSDSS